MIMDERLRKQEAEVDKKIREDWEALQAKMLERVPPFGGHRGYDVYFNAVNNTSVDNGGNIHFNPVYRHGLKSPRALASVGLYGGGGSMPTMG